MDAQNLKLRSGYTTGSCAAAAAKAAATSLIKGEKVDTVQITLPGGEEVTFQVSSLNVNCQKASAGIVKDAGDDPDVTHGTTIWAEVELKGNEIQVKGGKGVGTVTKPGLSAPVGGPAINPTPLKMIKDEVKKVLPPGKGAEVVISVPEGEKLAKKTLNPKLGIVGGISILGTTGIVRPMSDEAYINSLIPQIHQTVALGYNHIVLTPGGMGNKMAEKMGVNRDCIAQTSNFIGMMLTESLKSGIKGAVLFGHIGKLIKVAAGIFNTHSKVADARKETLAAYTALEGVAPEIITGIMEANTAEEGVEILKRNKLEKVFFRIAEAVSKRAEEHCSGEIKVGTVLYSLKGEILGYDNSALEIGEVVGWKPQ